MVGGAAAGTRGVGAGGVRGAGTDTGGVTGGVRGGGLRRPSIGHGHRGCVRGGGLRGRTQAQVGCQRRLPAQAVDPFVPKWHICSLPLAKKRSLPPSSTRCTRRSLSRTALCTRYLFTDARHGAPSPSHARRRSPSPSLPLVDAHNLSRTALSLSHTALLLSYSA